MEYNFVISGTIGSWWSNANGQYVRWMLSQNKGKEVHVGFCSPGGTVKDGLEMYQAFKDHGNVHAHAFGLNASISTIAMLGCKSIDIVKGSFFLIHNVSTAIDHYEMANEGRINEMLKELKLEQEQLETFDDVLASLYVDRCKKTKDEVLAQMKKGTWMSAQQALEFGLVDSIREDDKAEKAALQLKNEFVNSYNNNIYQDAGIPPLSVDESTADMVNGLDVVDAEGNPTPNFLQKTWKALQNLLSNQQAPVNTTEMEDKKTIDATEQKENTAQVENTVSVEELNKKVNDLTASVDTLKADKVKLENELKEKDAIIENLKNSPAVDQKTDEIPVQTAKKEMSAKDVFNLINI